MQIGKWLIVREDESKKAGGRHVVIEARNDEIRKVFEVTGDHLRLRLTKESAAQLAQFIDEFLDSEITVKPTSATK